MKRDFAAQKITIHKKGENLIAFCEICTVSQIIVPEEEFKKIPCRTFLCEHCAFPFKENLCRQKYLNLYTSEAQFNPEELANKKEENTL